MKKVTSLDLLRHAIEGGSTFQYKENGRTFNSNVVSILNMKLIDIISMINEGSLFYDEYYSMR